MIDILSGTRRLILTPYERISEPEEPDYDRIMVWVQFSIPLLKTEFSAEFSAGQLKQAKDATNLLYQAIREGKTGSDAELTSLFNQVDMKFHQSDFGGAVGVSLILRPENHADSVTLTDFFGIDESYFPEFISGIAAIMTWEN